MSRRGLPLGASLTRPGRPRRTRHTLPRAPAVAWSSPRGIAERVTSSGASDDHGDVDPNGGGSQRLASRSGPPDGDLFFNLMDQVEGAFFPSFRWEVLPAGKRRQVQRLSRRVLETIEVLSPPPYGVLLGPAEPSAREGFARDQGTGGVYAPPILRTRDEILLTAVREDVLQPRDLRPFFPADEDRLISPRPDLVLPGRRRSGTRSLRSSGGRCGRMWRWRNRPAPIFESLRRRFFMFSTSCHTAIDLISNTS